MVSTIHRLKTMNMTHLQLEAHHGLEGHIQPTTLEGLGLEIGDHGGSGGIPIERLLRAGQGICLHP